MLPASNYQFLVYGMTYSENKISKTNCGYNLFTYPGGFYERSEFANAKLANWIAVQRLWYRKGKLTEERKEKLLSVGFDFEP